MSSGFGYKDKVDIVKKNKAVEVKCRIATLKCDDVKAMIVFIFTFKLLAVTSVSILKIPTSVIFVFETFVVKGSKEIIPP